MKKLIAIILALITALLVTPNRGVDPSPVAVVNPPQTAITERVGQVCPRKAKQPQKRRL